MTQRTKMAYLAGMMFVLAGCVEFAAFLAGRPPRPSLMALGGLFFAVGALWLMVGVSFKKKDQARLR